MCKSKSNSIYILSFVMPILGFKGTLQLCT